MSNTYYQGPQFGAIDANLQFYSSSASPSPSTSQHPNSAASLPPASSFYSNRPSLDPGSRPSVVAGRIGSSPSGATGAVGSSVAGYGSGQPTIVQNWWNAFTPWTGQDGEPPLLQELGVNFDHILQKSLTVLNPLSKVDSHIMDDADLAGPLVFCSVFAGFLLLVSRRRLGWEFSGKPQFSYIYGVALVGSASIYILLNLMSERGIDAYRTASVLGYCLLPLVLLSMISVVVSLESLIMSVRSGSLGYIVSGSSIAWCSYSASAIFSSVLQLSSQRLLVAYPVGLLYAAFAMLSVFDGRSGVVLKA
ncbi:BZ3500_MvSof-1268-A1-R1_Chr7-2g09526 [Microbotryum saponariae]|uniref:Protein YIP n=1 Tax=Microbotryum saponariae TaxID=289078 RepID=A0A2X0KYY4_9BASI|nr:BZ3501_MvSof-1269-A2-R1_Chr7-1g09226 [Microbotryum saponariae]SDA02635.1 BZ3500_MvSof-1268-A1-R1_Chr7-2g09526 [Microbotryum saponariae]